MAPAGVMQEADPAKYSTGVSFQGWCQKDGTTLPAPLILTDDQDAQSVQVFSLIARSDPPRGDDVRPVSPVAAECRRLALRERDRSLP